MSIIPIKKVATVSIPIPTEEQCLDLYPADLFNLRKAGFISTDTFVFLAIKISFDHLNPSIHVNSFCELWQLEREEFLNSAEILKASGYEFELVPPARPDDVVLGGNDNKSQPRSDDAVLGGN
ncbi:MAG: hypothetical protein F6K31_03065 [Symploca sp. SIO2G7]|nr:hypothetical protein [Symploca sp. SIO2G7]